MPTLRELQSSFRAAMHGDDPVAIAAAVVVDRLAPARRLQIYRNHYDLTLGEALAATFPVVRRLVGESFFGFAARQFTAAEPPCGPCLFEYGAGFPDFLAELPACRSLPYLPDVARLEWAINLAYHASDVPALGPGDLSEVAPAQMPDLAFVLHPSCRLLESRYPVDRIWRVNQPDADPAVQVDLAESGVRLFVRRRGLDVEWRTLDAAEYAFLHRLGAGRSVQQAFEAATATGPLDLTSTLAGLVADGALTGFLDTRTAR
ncbi:MAG: HvfC/BufC N-terminal domain-containing protein [Pseudomonadota bacterium]